MAFVVVILPCSLALQVQGQCHGCPSWTRGSRLSLSHHRQSLERSHLETEIKHLEKLQKVSKHLRNIRPRPSMPVLPRLRQKHLQGNASFWTYDVYDVSEDHILSNCTTLHDELASALQGFDERQTVISRLDLWWSPSPSLPSQPSWTRCAPQRSLDETSWEGKGSQGQQFLEILYHGMFSKLNIFQTRKILIV